jgi:AGCS family alanine or glycine:cation symporter
MTLLFATLSVIVIIIRHEVLPTVISEIFRDAFDFSSADSVLGGVGGFFLSRSVRLGVSRGLLSNEGGAGTSPMAHSTSSSDNAVEQGFLGIAEVLIDTLILCTLTAIVTLISYPSVKMWGENSVMMTLGAYSSVLGAWVEPLMCVLVSLFALATVFTQTYYGMSCLLSITKSRVALRVLTLAYSLSAIVGSCAPPDSVWGLADFSIGIMTVINVSVLLIEQKTIAKLTADYFASE